MQSGIRIVALMLACGTLLLAAGCAGPSQSGYVYTDRETRQPMQVQSATIQSVRGVSLERNQPAGIGTAAGAVVGGVAGSNVGRGKGAIVGSVLGALVGGMTGSHLEQGAGNRAALEITVRTDEGRTLAIVQEAGDDRFEAGQRVRLLTTARGQVRVAPQ
jgi:outer membrane lipoprotein SlyB